MAEMLNCPNCGDHFISDRYKRNGSSTIFAALEVATGQVVASNRLRKRCREFLDFMNEVVAVHPAAEFHVVLDNHSTHSKKGDRWAEEPSARPFPLHADQRVMAESGGCLLQHPVARRAPGGQL